MNPNKIIASSHLVNLNPYGSKSSMEPINAVFVNGYRRKKQFIATEVPNSNTVEKFWRMVQQQKANQIIVLNEPQGNREVRRNKTRLQRCMQLARLKCSPGCIFFIYERIISLHTECFA